MTLPKKVKNDLFDYKNRYIMQLENGFKFSLDSILLAEYVKIKDDDFLLDMCTGNAAVPLIISTKTKAKIVGYEIQKDIAALANESVTINGLIDQINIINDDIKNINHFYKSESFDIITCNPPYFKVTKHKYQNENEYLALARHEIAITLEDIFAISFKYLKNNGAFYLVHRAERLDDIMYLGRINRLNVKEIQFISTKQKDEANTVIVKCIKNSKCGVKVKKEICVEGLTTYQNLFK